MYAIKKTAMALVLLVATAAFAMGSMAKGDNASKAAPMKFVGTYYGLSGAVVSFHSDGTMTGESAYMFSENPDSLFQGRKANAAKGVWRVVGNNTIRTTNIRFVTEAFGHNYEPDGAILKSTWEGVFDKSVQGRSPGYTVDTIRTEIFLPGQNPLTDEPVLVMENPFDGRGLRMEVE